MSLPSGTLQHSSERVQLSCQDWGCCLFIDCCDEKEGDKVLAGQL